MNRCPFCRSYSSGQRICTEWHNSRLLFPLRPDQFQYPSDRIQIKKDRAILSRSRHPQTDPGKEGRISGMQPLGVRKDRLSPFRILQSFETSQERPVIASLPAFHHQPMTSKRSSIIQEFRSPSNSARFSWAFCKVSRATTLSRYSNLSYCAVGTS